VLFQADVRGVSPATTLGRLAEEPAAQAMLDDVDDVGADLAPGIDGFTRTLVLGVAEHQTAIDELVGRYARRWQVHRMPVVDRNVLRLATYELVYQDTSAAVVINEAVNLAKSLSTEDSGRYVNGVLESIRKHVASSRGDEGC
jgi:transcription antitermination protein NusB